MAIIEVHQLVKSFRVADKEPGFAGTLKHFVRRKYRDVEAVKGISFDIAPGEMVGFLGPNGAGKTTTLKMLTGLIHPTAGRVTVAGSEPFQRPPAFLKRITMVMGQKQQLIWDLPALDSLRINGAVYEIPEAECQRRIKELADMLELDEQLTKPVRKLSLGERMKAELLAALLHRPDVLFLDEPTLGLDVNAQASVREFLRQYNQRYRATILLTSHYMADITALCPRVLIIHQGKLMFDGDLDGILARFAPCREISIETKQPIDPATLHAYGDVLTSHGRIARLIVRREDLTASVGRLMADFDLRDLTVNDPPIEETIARIFTEANANEQTMA
ncbi:MAG: ATP-binding cassette domain-containing protein [Lentisphaerae bacterium]|jgi:ABC-2 type transport system ATP-binding protein|nr:ATP-binding cassette domain-containing protein [Lentisphaerota bacterium]MBT4822071.1 ATP-binding cassette domain-containing protein [Lentisphaerota bacterium]MBT5610658.1 ATP-binding cassette domain-containing protein [Lentisphaerota bacterium]MBT7059457.1 ATP-binding cassette domain-containing protein [Lentisphaerota bacterium]MBT7847841.1 ATP-binding cassette domain-containing protein [Lentisphaerota bacterium]